MTPRDHKQLIHKARTAARRGDSAAASRWYAAASTQRKVRVTEEKKDQRADRPPSARREVTAEMREDLLNRLDRLAERLQRKLAETGARNAQDEIEQGSGNTLDQ